MAFLGSIFSKLATLVAIGALVSTTEAVPFNALSNHLQGVSHKSVAHSKFPEFTENHFIRCGNSHDCHYQKSPSESDINPDHSKSVCIKSWCYTPFIYSENDNAAITNSVEESESDEVIADIQSAQGHSPTFHKCQNSGDCKTHNPAGFCHGGYCYVPETW